MEEDIFEGTFSNMNIVMHVLEDIDKRFLEDYKKNVMEKIWKMARCYIYFY